CRLADQWRYRTGAPLAHLASLVEILNVLQCGDRHHDPERRGEVDMEKELHAAGFAARAAVRADVRYPHAGRAEVRPANGLEAGDGPDEVGDLRGRHDYRGVNVDSVPVEIVTGNALLVLEDKA